MDEAEEMEADEERLMAAAGAQAKTERDSERE